MDIDYESVIDFGPAKKLIKDRGLKIKWLAEKTGLFPSNVSLILKNEAFPKTDVIAKMCWVLNVRPSEIISFKIDADDRKKMWFENKELPYLPEPGSSGELTYEPLRLMTNMYLDYLYEETGKDKSVDDLLDMIEPYRRRNGFNNGLDYKAALEKRFGKDYVPKRSRAGQFKAKGLTNETRTKLKNDRPVNIRTVYDICNFFGCSIDWVMSYK